MDKKDNLDRIQIVLVDTIDAANIGSVCRAMKTMGIKKLAIVSNRNYDKERIKTLSIHAYDIFENAVFYNTLEDALINSVYSIAATRRRGKNRKADYLSPKQLASKITKTGEGLVSIVFGREDSGLSDEEINKCSQIVTIATSDDFSSLNLAQAVQIITYELYDSLKPWPVENTPVTKLRITNSVNDTINNLVDINYFKQNTDKGLLTTLLNDVYERAGLSESELKKLEKFFDKNIKLIKYKK